MGRLREEGIKTSLKICHFRTRYFIIKKLLRIKYIYRYPPPFGQSLWIKLKWNLFSQFQKRINPSPGDDEILGGLRNFRSRSKPIFFFATEDKEDIVAALKKHFSAEIQKSVAVANKVCEHDFEWLSANCPGFGEEVIWDLSFSHNERWPLDFYLDLDYRSEKRLGDVREVWELNRHQYFVTLGKAYWFTDEDKYAQEFVDQIIDWIEKNPVGYGINWLHSQEVALRAVAWVWALYFFKDYGNLEEEKQLTILKSIYEHGDYIAWNLSDKPVTHNHLISETCGLAIIGIMFPKFRKARKWREKGLHIFEREVIKQIWEDGLDGELSTNYHCFVLDSFLQLSILMEKNGIECPEDVKTRIEKMIEAVMYLLRPDGSLPWIGDCDGGRAYRLSESNPCDRRAYLAIGAAQYGRRDFKRAAEKFYEEAFWLLGNKGLRKFAALDGQEPQDPCKFFRHGGLATMRESWNPNSEYIIFRGGPTERRPGVGITHNHADFLSFELFSNSIPILVDPGVFLYGLDDKWRFFYRKSLAHNTLVVDGIDHVNVTATRFGIPNLPLSRINELTFDNDYGYIDMSHGGYRKMGILHRRRLLWFKGDCLMILDHINGTGVHQIEAFFHFNRDVHVFWEKGGIVQANQSGSKSVIRLVPFSIEPNECELVSGEVAPIQGWISPCYGRKCPSSVVKYSWTQHLPLTLGHLLITNPEAKILVNEFRQVEEGWELLLTRRHRRELIQFMDAGGIHIQRPCDPSHHICV